MKDLMIVFFAGLGLAACVAVVLGAVIPGVAFHAYFGTSEGANKWHEQAIVKRSSEVVIK